MDSLQVPRASHARPHAAGQKLRGTSPWWTATAAIFVQLVGFSMVLLFLANSLVVSTPSSWILGRDYSVSDYTESARIERASTNVSAVAADYSKAGKLDRRQVFDVERALDDLEEITKTPHSLNDQRSLVVRDYLRKTISRIIQDSNAEFHDPVVNGTVAEFGDDGTLVYWEDSSLIVRVPGTSDEKESVLVEAHYDAVPISHGAYDDGVGVVVCLELLRNLVRYPVRHPVVINIDWGEEDGLFGAMLFARFHPWAEDVRGYLNLEAGGVGGRAIVFRASHQKLLEAYQRAVDKPSASLIGNDALKLGIVKSDTDFSVFTTKYGIPGIDIAFADHRNFYHSERDNFHQSTSASVLSMGAVSLSTLREIADSPDTLKAIPRSSLLPPRPVAKDANQMSAAAEPAGDEQIVIVNLQHVVVKHSPITYNAVENAVFYDILNRFMVVRSYGYEMALNIAIGILGLFAIFAAQYPFIRPVAGVSAEEMAELRITRRIWLQCRRSGFVGGLFEGFGVLLTGCLSSLAGALIFTGLMITLVVPRLAYTHIYLQVMLQFAAAALSMTCVLTAWVRRSRLHDIEHMVWYSHSLLRSAVLLFVVVPLNAREIGLMYREQWYAVAALISVACTAMLDSSTGIGRLWRARLASATGGSVTRSLADGQSSEHAERLLTRASSDTSISQTAPGTPRVDSNSYIAITQHIISGVRFVIGVLAPLLIGSDILLRQLAVLKDQLPDGSPPIACLAITALDITTFLLFMAPYALNTMIDLDRYWLIHYVGDKSTTALQKLWSSGSTRALGVLSSARSQISLHTNHAESQHDIDEESQGIVSPRPESTDDDNIRILISGNERSPTSNEEEQAAAQADSNSVRSSIESGDDELGHRPLGQMYKKREAPETIGLRMIYAWTVAWIVLWVYIQLRFLSGEGYDKNTNPLKVRVFQSTQISTKCTDGCVRSSLNLLSPDSNGLVRVVRDTAPAHVTPVCFTKSTADMYECKLPWVPAADSSWNPATAINVTSVSRSASSTEHGTVFTVDVRFTAPESRTCYMDFGTHRGLSPQAYPNPSPAYPPALPSNNTVIDRVVLPVLERAGFGDKPLVAEPFLDRDPIFASRIYAHRRSFDGEFAARIVYSVPLQNATQPVVMVELSCNFDVVDRHTPLLASIISNAPEWTGFTPYGNRLSTVTLTDVSI